MIDWRYPRLIFCSQGISHSDLCNTQKRVISQAPAEDCKRNFQALPAIAVFE
jgi:hypothetical protein